MKKKLYAIGTIIALTFSITSCDGLGISDFYSSVDLTDADILALGADLEFPELNKIGISSEDDLEITVHNVRTYYTDYFDSQVTDETLTTTSDSNMSGSVEASLYANFSSQEDFYIKGQVAVSSLDISNVTVTNNPDHTAANESTTGSASVSAILLDRAL